MFDWFYLNLSAIVLLIFCLTATGLCAKESTNKYWVYFNNKGLIPKSDLETALSKRTSEISTRSKARRFENMGILTASEDDLPVDQYYLDILRDLLDQEETVTSRWLNAATFYLNPAQREIVKGLTFVDKIEPVKAFRRNPGNPKNAGRRYPENVRRDDEHEFDYGNSIVQHEFLDIPSLHDMGILGEGVVIGITDAGFENLDHDCLEDLDILDSWDFVNDDDNVENEDDDGDGSHGIKTLSVMAAFDPGNLIGIAPKASYILAKTENTDEQEFIEEDYWVEAVEWMEEIGVDVISVSLSYGSAYDYDELDGDHGVTTIVADHAAQLGVVVVAAAGNHAREDYPLNKIATPADGDSVVAVGALDTDSTRTVFSSYGPTFDGRTKPDVVTLGVDVVCASSRDDDEYVYQLGTSFSTPAIAGLCALLIESNPYATATQIRRSLTQSAHNREEPDTLIGWGIPNGPAAVQYLSIPENSMTIRLRGGWNLISHNLEFLDELLIVDAFENIVERGNLEIVKDWRGNFYSPITQFDNIVEWESKEGYLVKVTNQDSLILQGDLTDYRSSFDLVEGWQLISYLPDFPMNPTIAFAELGNAGNLILAKDEFGRFIVPDYNYSNMPDLIPGKGYYVNLRNVTTFKYPRIRLAGNNSIEAFVTPEYFQLPPAGEISFNLLFEVKDGIMNGDEVAVISQNEEIIGAGTVQNNRCGVAVWDTHYDKGYELRLFQSNSGNVIVPDYQWLSNPLDLTANGYGVIEISVDESHQENTERSSVEISPNPFNSSFTLDFKNLRDEASKIKIYDISGKLIVSKDISEGESRLKRIEFQSDEWSAGHYILAVESNESILRKKITLIR